MKMRIAVPAAVAVAALALVAVIAVRPGAVEEPVRAIMNALMGGGGRAAPQTSARPASTPPATTPPAPSEGTPAPHAAAVEKPKSVRLHGIGEPKAKPAGAVRLATYNLENFFDPLKPGEQPGKARDDATEGESQPLKPIDERKALAAAIKAVNADVLALDEVESLETLTRFRDEYLSDLGYVHIASIDAGDRRGIEQSVLSRFPIKEAVNWPGMELGGTHPAKWGKQESEWAGQPIKFARSPLKVVVEVPVGSTGTAPAKTLSLTLFAIHHKSGGPGGYWREREAAKVAELAKAAAGAAWADSAAVAVLGDCNARLSEPPLQEYLKVGFIDAMGDKPEADPVWITHSSGRVIDHIFLSPFLAKRMVAETRFVLGTMTRPEGVDWRNTPNPPGWASDHYPVVVDFKFE